MISLRRVSQLGARSSLRPIVASTAVRSFSATRVTEQKSLPPPRFFDFQTVKANLSVDKAFKAVEHAFGELADGKVDVPQPMHIGIHETATAGPGDCHIKGGYVEGATTFTVKLATVSFYKNLEKGLPPGGGVFVVCSAVTGAPLGIFQENRFMTDLRTGAAGGIAVKYFAAKHHTSVAFIGPGAIARVMAQGAAVTHQFKQGYAYGLDTKMAEGFAEWCKSTLGYPVKVCETAEEAVRGGDVVFTQTPGSKPVLELSWLRPHATIIASGSDQPTKNEIPPEVQAKAKFVCDLVRQCNRLGELRTGIESGLVKESDVYAEIGEVVKGRKKGREGDELILVDLTGTGAQDAAIGQVAWDILSKKMAGSDDERERRARDKKKRRRNEDESHSRRSREGARKDRSRSRSADREKKRSSGKRKSAKRSPSGSRSPARSPSKTDKARSNGAVKQELPAGKQAEPTLACDQPRKKSRFAEPATITALPQAPPTVTAASSAIPSISPAAVSFAAAQAQAKAAEIAWRIGVPTGPMAPPPPQPVAAAPVVAPPQVFPPTPAAGGAPVAATAAPTLLGMPGQAAALQEQIRRQMEQVQAALRLQQQKEQQQQQQAAAAAPEKKPVFRPMRFDEYGREVDEEGNVIKMDLSGIRTVKVNIAGPTVKEQKEKPAEDENPYLSTATADEDDALATLDPRLKMKDRSRRQTRAFAFVKPGTFVKQAEKIRDKERSRILAGFASGRNARAYSYSGLIDDGDDSAKGDIPSVVRLQALPAPPEDAVAPVPAMEWWDEAYLPRDKKAVLAKDPSGYDHVSIENSKTYTYVQHPVPLKGMYERKSEEVGMPTFLTKKERKRLRKQARAEREREKRDKIALGLMQPPAPKLNLANFMKVLANESIADPSAVTAKIQAQIEQRKKNHDMRNTARKLTPEEKREKKRKKIVQDKIKQIEVAVFRVRDLSSPKIRYKIDVNAQQTGLSGCVVTCKDPIFGDEGLSLVVVEGGPKAIRRYIKLMIRRIKWDAKDDNDQEEEDDDDDDEDEDDVGGSAANGAKKCEMVWKGIVPKPSFTGFKFQECRTVTTARKVLESRNVAHYWDMVVRAGDGLPPGF